MLKETGTMTYLKRLPLLLALIGSLAAAGCGDDEKKDDDGGDDMAGDGDGDVDAGPPVGGTCAADGTFVGHTAEEVFALAMMKTEGACRSMVDSYEACATNPSGLAGVAGRACLTAGAMPGPQFDECVKNGEGDIKGIKDGAPRLSDACTTCYVDAVNCSRENCTLECIDPENVEGCATCREDNGCTSTFYTCSGFPTLEELDAK
jgi:hypothetical protein